MLTAERQLDVTANNLANVGTTGFKRELLTAIAAPSIETVREPSFPRFPQYLPGQIEHIGSQNSGVQGFAVHTDFSAGPIVHTGRALDVAISNGGFFTVADAQGRIFYTRDGAFAVTSDGTLVTSSRHVVQGLGGPIQTNGEGSATISPSGAVLVDGAQVDFLQIAFFDDVSQLKPIGKNLFSGPTPDGVGTVNLITGAIEQSNSDVIGSMVKLIENHRLFEAESRILQTLDSTIDRAVNTLGRPV